MFKKYSLAISQTAFRKRTDWQKSSYSFYRHPQLFENSLLNGINMKKRFNDLVKSSFSSLGFYVARKFPNCINGYSLRDDLSVLIPKHNPLCFDIGANQGQTIQLLQHAYPEPFIHAFEPSSITFSALATSVRHSRLQLHQLALGEHAAWPNFEITSNRNSVHF